MNSDQNFERTFVERVLIGVGVVLLALLLVLLIYYTFNIVLLIFAAVLLAIFLRGIADLVGRYVKIGEGWLVLLVSILLLGILAGAIALLAPSVAEQGRHLREELPRSIQQVSNFISQYGWGRAIIEQLPSADDAKQIITDSGFLSSLGGFFSSTLGAIGNFFVVILLAIYLATEPKLYAHGFTKLFPTGRRSRVNEVLGGIGETLRWWLIGKVGSMIFIGILTWIGLSIIGVPLALTLGLIAGLLSFIPNFGPIISALPAILLAFIDSPITAVYVLILYVGVQLIESNLVTPIIERETVELPPALTIIFQLALSVMIGGLGLVLATPLLAVVMVIVQMVYIHDVLGDKEEFQRKDAKEQRREEFEGEVADKDRLSE